ncbi:hypothetical protein [Sphingobium sp.]|uniref:hypothetical protein n=1 Tax=Sphingobium sp. TaxID=1912891 RepID=UPI0028BE676E|nr:hypothetical protein [Sphingobium sp.]
MKSGGLPCALACLLTSQAAWARQDIRLDRQMFVERISTDINGRERRILESAERAGSGDQLVFVLQWRNEGNRPVRGLALTNAVPRGTRIDLANPAMQVSVDGGAHWGRLNELWLPTPLGGVRRAGPADITHVRWTLSDEISPGESGRLSYRATMR